MSRPFSSAPSSGIRSSRPDLTAVRGRRGRRPPSHSRPTDACPRIARPTSLTSGAAVHRPTATVLTRQIRCLVVGVLAPCVSADVLSESRESHHHAGIPLPPVGVGRMAAPTVRVRLVSLPKTIDHIGALSTRGQLGHERPEHLRRTRTDGIRCHDRTTRQKTDRIPARYGFPVMRPTTLLRPDPTNTTARGTCAERSEDGRGRKWFRPPVSSAGPACGRTYPLGPVRLHPGDGGGPRARHRGFCIGMARPRR